MHAPGVKRLLVTALAVLVGLTSALRQVEGATLLVAADHAHVLLEHDHEHDRFHSHAMLHERGDNDDLTVARCGEGHPHTCLDLGIPSGDWRPSLKAGAGLAVPLVALPPVPITAAEDVAAPSLRVPRASPTLGIPPPELLRSTVLLI